MAAIDRARSARIMQTKAAIRARHWVRRKRDDRDDVAIRQARQLVRSLNTDPPDILYLGDSISIWTHPDDKDTRSVQRMICDELGPDVSMFTVTGGSYSARLHESYLRMLEVSDHRPLIINTLWVRGCTVGWTEHPVFGHKRSIEAMDALDLSAPVRRLRTPRPKPAPEEWDAFYRLPYPTVGKPDATIGDFAPLLRDLSRWAEDDPERLRLLYLYHYGASIEGTWGLDAYTQMGKRVRELGCPVVAYQNPIPVDSCREVIGEELVDLAASNWELLDRAYAEGVGDHVEIVRSGMAVREGEFLGRVDSSEHLNEHGRRRLVEMLVPAIRRALDGAGSPGTGR
jgi:hypothetical protein